MTRQQMMFHYSSKAFSFKIALIFAFVIILTQNKPLQPPSPFLDGPGNSPQQITLPDQALNGKKLGKRFILPCQIENQPEIIPDRPGTGLGRNLFTPLTHGLLLYPQYLNGWQLLDPEFDINSFQQIWGVCAKYIQETIKVQTSSLLSTSPPSNCFDYPIPQRYYTNGGFDQNNLDMMVTVRFYSNSSSSTLASAGACAINRRPTYGYIQTNIAQWNSNLLNTAIMQKQISLILHQWSHMLGISSYFWVSENRYRSAYLSSTYKPLSQVSYSFNGKYNNRHIIVLSQVVSYVRNYFNCLATQQPIFGALTEDLDGTVGSHLDRFPYFDSYMTGSLFFAGARMDQVTLRILAGSNFYLSVDVTKTADFQFGRNKGCKFGLGDYTGFTGPQICTTSSIVTCDFYGRYGGSCGTDTRANGFNYIGPYTNTICDFPQLKSGFSQLDYGWNSRCFMGNSTYYNTRAHCYVARCIGGNIEITVDGVSSNCTTPGSIITVGSSTQKATLTCPIDFSVFCARTPCDNWCSSKGVCLKDGCHSSNCQSIDPNCNVCTDDATQCRSCLLSYVLSLDSLTCLSCSAQIINCQTCYRDNSIVYCSVCIGQLVYSPSRLSCVTCQSLITNCATCNQNVNAITCAACLIGYLPSVNTLSCIQCPSNCSSCISNVGVLQCTSCFTGTYLNGIICSTCQVLNPNCLSCSNTGICTACIQGYALNSENKCIQCSTSIINCVSCLYNANILTCSNCIAPYILINGGLSCGSSCTDINCATCNSLNNNQCTTCKQFYALNPIVLNCTACSTIAGCTICSFGTSNNLQCNGCSNGLFLSNSICLTCSQLIINCQTCNSSNLCTTCLNGYATSNGQTCQKCPIQCVQCSLTNQIFSCISCPLNKFVSNGHCLTCQQITLNCLSCNSLGVCLSCQSKYTISSVNSKCIACPVSCSECIDNAGTLQCTSCPTSTYLSGGNCLTCSQLNMNCQTCDGSGICTSCNVGFGLNSSKICVSCSQLANCIQCNFNTGSFACTKCSGIFIPINSGTLCSNCVVPNCLTCSATNANICISCKIEYGLNTADGTCVACNSIANCTACSINAGSVVCSNCSTGLYLQSNKCVTCSVLFANCQTCNAAGTACTACNKGYSVSTATGQCICNVANCAECSANGCNTCQPSYKKIGKKCQ